MKLKKTIGFLVLDGTRYYPPTDPFVIEWLQEYMTKFNMLLHNYGKEKTNRNLLKILEFYKGILLGEEPDIVSLLVIYEVYKIVDLNELIKSHFNSQGELRTIKKEEDQESKSSEPKKKLKVTNKLLEKGIKRKKISQKRSSHYFLW